MDTSKRDKRIIMLLTIFTIVFTFFGASLAYWNWSTSEAQKTNVVFTLTQDFSCAVDGGGDITQDDAFIAPSNCLKSNGQISENVIMREITVTPTIFRNNLTIYMELWLEIKSLQEGLANSNNFKYAFTTSNVSCDTGVVETGNLKGLTTGDTQLLLSRNFSNSQPEKYYLWIWLDAAETSQTTMNQSFSLTLGGACTDAQILIVPDGGMYMVGTPEDEVNPSPMSYSMKRLATNNVCNYEDAVVYNSGEAVNVESSTCDKYLFGDYEYIYNAHIVNQSVTIDESLNGWGVININSTSSPGQILSTINGKDVVSMSETFMNSNILTSPKLPNTIKNMNNTFNGCSALKGTIKINANPITYSNIFANTSNSIKIVGTSLKLNEIASTANNGNVTVGDNVPEAPVLDEGMIPVKLSSNGTVTTVFSSDPTWYNYENREWANVVLVDNDSRSTYKNTTGVTVNQDDILAYYVWIPRYKYRIPSVKCSTIDTPTIEDYPTCYRYIMSDTDQGVAASVLYQYALSKGVTSYTMAKATSDIEDGLENGYIRMTGLSVGMMPAEAFAMYYQLTGSMLEYSVEYAPDNIVVEVANEINIRFEYTESEMQMGDAVNTYRTHPAFWWDDNSNGNVDSGEMVAGIWVGKFETIPNTDSTCYTDETEEDCIYLNVSPRILPNVSSLRNQNVSNQFLTSQKFSASGNIYGLSHTSTNAHMMKNSEWGAVAYLSHSVYGINVEIRINNNNNYITGCGASVENSYSTSDCEISYNSLSTPQSTTGNITGVFDMSGGTNESVMGVLADSSGNPRSGSSSSFNSGFNGLLFDDTSYTLGINFPASKYYDLYTGISVRDSCNGGLCYGDALYETYGWYKDNGGFVYLDTPWFYRGGVLNGSGAGAFHSGSHYGVASDDRSWRSVLVVGYGP